MNKTTATNIAFALIALLFASCASMEQAQPYFEVAASIGTTQFLASAKTPEARAQYVTIIQEVGNVVLTLSSGLLLTPDQFHAEVIARIPNTSDAAQYLAVVDGVYAVAYVDFKDRPELKNDYINKIAQIILANAH